ncbi:MAG: sugar transferase, partial [Lapillicoccus sp.]
MTDYAGTFRGTESTWTAGGFALRASTPRWLIAYRVKAVSADLAVAAAAALACYGLRFGTNELHSALWLVVATPVWVLTVALVGGYRVQVLGTGSDEYRAIGRAATFIACVIALVSFTANLDLPRGVVMPLVPVLLAGSLVGHAFVRQGLFNRRQTGDCLLDTVVVGRSDSVASMIREIASAPEAGMRVVGACVSGLDGQRSDLDTVEGVPVYGPPEAALTTVDSLGATVVAVSSHPDLVGTPLRRLGWALAERNVDLFVSPGIVEVAGPRLSLRPAAGLSLLHVERPISSGGRMIAKRALDSVVGFGLVVAALPVLLVIAALIKSTSAGPVFFRQERVGVHGQSFRMFKFRTMVVDAEQRLLEMNREGQVNSVLFKERNDPRVTAVGRVLRRFSLDELPQLLNVLLGDMSLVGPRPPLRREVDLYEPDAVQRLRVRP